MIPPRCTSEQVIALLKDNYDYLLNPPLDPFISIASPWVDRVVALAPSKGFDGYWTLNPIEAQNLETLLAAHCYCRVDKTYQSKSTNGQSATFTGQTGLALDATEYGQMAKMADPSGVLVNLDKRQIVRGFYLGRKHRGPPNQFPYGQE